MNYKSKNQLVLQNLFELRKVHSVTERLSSGRVFFIENQMGLCDATGAIWPIGKSEYLNQSSFNQGDLITFRCKILKLNENTESKYDDCYFIKVTEILQKTNSLEEWENAVIPNPIPSKDFILKQQKQNDQTQISHFYHSPASTRIKLIKQRNRSLERVHSFFKNRGFLCIETPTLVPSGGMEVYLNPFATNYIDHRGQKWELQLPTSPEFALKKIMTEGTEKIFQLSRAYRNIGEVSKQHEPEFIMLEWYRANANLRTLIEDTQNLVLVLSEFLGTHLDIPKQWPVFRVDKLFKDILSIDLEQVQNRDLFYEKAKLQSHSIVESDDWDSLFYKLFMEKIEPFLLQQKACFVTHYPIQMGALAAQETSLNSNNETIHKPYVERLEAYINGVEICNGYFELNDAHVLKERFQKTKTIRNELKSDLQFENAMKFGLPPCSGNALGIDRVISLLLGLEQISNLYPIPFLSQFPKDSVAWE
ncbi:amino acid--tRNA ligase-related protein [Silvanigrella sp.]|jgi:lysyl-tRNA synthetase class 2|uniref:amino acid--tRNA ligase-related protein n=1 Tax=Silvanigrella sp. TaxID=2024976 RepID=UPI0037CC11E6|nr:hypothetical protein [Silvanigrellaceae bacterium]